MDSKKKSSIENKYGNNKPICQKYFSSNNHLPYTKITCNRDKYRFDLKTNTFQEYKNDAENACIKHNKNSKDNNSPIKPGGPSKNNNLVTSRFEDYTKDNRCFQFVCNNENDCLCNNQMIALEYVMY